jgi:hypothetical protein
MVIEKFALTVKSLLLDFARDDAGLRDSQFQLPSLIDTVYFLEGCS